METSGSDHWTTDIYTIPHPGSHLSSMSMPSIQEFETVGSEMVSDYVVDQNVYYTTAMAPANYYGYVYTGFESPGEWDGHYKFFGLDGQVLQYQGMQTEGLQYAYYPPPGYAQSPYNAYCSYIPGTVIGPDSPVMTQQYVSSPAYQQPIISPSYFPVVFHPGADIIPSISPDPSQVNSGGSSATRSDGQVVKYTLPSSSIPAATSSHKDSIQASAIYTHSSPKSAEASHAYAVKKNSIPGNMPSSRPLPVSVQTSENFVQGNEVIQHAPLKVAIPSHNSFSDLGTDVYGWVPVDGTHPRMQFNGFLKTGSGTPDMLGEKNRGPRASRLKPQWTPKIVCKAYTTKAGVVDADGNLTINTDDYNRTDFHVSYPNGKFFVIKSYSEDDVHKSIKYNVWSSTPNGNRRLDAAYEDARRISGGNPSNCPVFLFFSVNASGQFCGVAEMIGPVDFYKDMDFWQQDKWTGSFPVKWHIIKDVSNASFRHIILENNENKPVTNSRDTQEILYMPGMNMLTIFKDSLLRTSIFDDFTYYEDRQRIMYEEKIRLLGRNYEYSTLFLPKPAPVKQVVTIREPPKVEVKLFKPGNVEGINSSAATNQVTSEIEDRDGSKNAPSVDHQDSSETGNTQISSDADKCGPDTRNVTGEDVSAASSGNVEDMSAASVEVKTEADLESTQQAPGAAGAIVQIASLSIDDKEEDAAAVAANPSAATAAGSSKMDVVNVGSVPVKVNGFVADTFTVGTIPIGTKSKSGAFG